MLSECYIQAIGAACYDQSGVTFPERASVDWENEILQGLLSPAPRWEHAHGWLSQPKVLVFMATPHEVKLVNDRLWNHPAIGYSFTVRARYWRGSVQKTYGG